MDKRKKNESKNQAIRIEGKKEKGEDKPKHSPERLPVKPLKIDLKEIDKIAFTETVKAPSVDEYKNKKKTDSVN